jgi:hypothetical protein
MSEVNPATVVDTKPWYASKGSVGALVAVVALSAGAAGYEIVPELQAQVVEAWLDVVALVGAVVALIGRLTATKKIV